MPLFRATFVNYNRFAGSWSLRPHHALLPSDFLFLTCPLSLSESFSDRDGISRSWRLWPKGIDCFLTYILFAYYFPPLLLSDLPGESSRLKIEFILELNKRYHQWYLFPTNLISSSEQSLLGGK